MSETVGIGDLVEMDASEILKEETGKATTKYLNTKLIKEKSVKKIEVKKVGKGYKRKFQDVVSGEVVERSFIDLDSVVLTEGELKGKEMVFSLNRTNMLKMQELYGTPDKWLGKILRLTLIKTNKGDSVAIDSD